MTTHKFLPLWTLCAPFAALAVLAGELLAPGDWYHLLQAAALLAGVLAAVHHAELVAHRVGEPLGTLVLAAAITTIEVALIVTLMLADEPDNAALARDAVFASVMIILNGIMGICLMVGGSRFGEQSFRQFAANSSLATLAAIVVLTLVLPNYTTTVQGPVYSPSQLAFVAIVSLLLYGTFLFVQTVRHRDYFLAEEAGEPAPRPSAKVAAIGGGLLVMCLAAVVGLAENLSPSIEGLVRKAGAPQSLVGVIIAAIVLLPEGWASLRAAGRNRLQTSLNQALGSALASIGLTIPAVALVSLASGMTLTLGIDGKSTVLLSLSLLVAALSLGTGRTTMLQGAVHLFIFAVYILTAIVP